MSDNKLSNKTAPPADANPGYEASDTRGRNIFIGLALSVVAVIIVVVMLNEFFVMTREDVLREQVGSRVDPKLAEVQARTTRNLTTYEWVDSTQGIVRIPIDRAMDLMVEEAYAERTRNARSTSR